MMENRKAEIEKNKEKKKKIYFNFIFFIVGLIISFGIAFSLQDYNEQRYQEAHFCFINEEYSSAELIYSKLGNYRDSEELLNQAAMYQNNLEIYESALKLLEAQKYDEALEEFEQIPDFKDVSEKIKSVKYNLAVNYYQKGDYDKAKQLFTELGDYLDSELYLAQIDIKNLEKSQEIVYRNAYSYYQNKDYKNALELLNNISGYKNSQDIINDCEKQLKRRSHQNILSAGTRNSVVITKEGNGKAVGNNDAGQCDISDWNNLASIDIYGYLTIGLQENGSANIVGKYDGKEIEHIENWSNLIDVAAGEQFVIGLKENGKVIADGHSDDGQLDVDKWEHIIAVDASCYYAVALTEEKDLLFAGFYNNQAEQFSAHRSEWKDVVNISTCGGGKDSIGGGHTVGLKSDGTLVAIGDNSYGQCDFSDKEKWSDIVKVAAGDWYTVGLKSNGRVVITGDNFSGHKYIDYDIIEAHDNIVDIAAGYGQTLLLTDEGEIICFGFIDDGKDKLNGYKGAMLPQY